MIRGYQNVQLIDQPTNNYSLYKVQNNGKNYFMHEFTSINQCDEYNFKVINKLVTCPHVPKIQQKFVQKNKTYFITQYFPSNLLKQQLKQPHQIFQLSKATQIFAKIVQLIEEIHQNKVIHRNLRLQLISCVGNQLYLNDFTLSKIVKRKERYFQVVGVTNYLAPQFYMEDGYGFEVDIWSAGVCLFFMLTGSFPFDFEDKNNDQILQEINSKCKMGFDFEKCAALTKKGNNIKSNKDLNELFKRLFEVNYTERITVSELKTHPALKEYFQPVNYQLKNKLQLSIIQEENTILNSSIFVSQLRTFPCHFEFHKQEIIFDFLEHSSEVLLLQSPNIISQKIRALVSFSILKVAVIKANNLIDVLLGKREPQFKVNLSQFEEIKNTAGFRKVKQKIEKKKKILEMLFRAAYLKIKPYKKDSNYYSDEIPSDFLTIKHEYRQNLSVMFQIEKQIIKKKQSRENVRRTCQNLARLTILCLINRIFKQPGVKNNFQLYYKWAKKQSLQDLQEWIQSERLSNLKSFIITITSKYMD